MKDLWDIRVATAPADAIPAGLRDSNPSKVVLPAPVAVNASNPGLLGHLSFLRESMSRGVSVSWHATGYDRSFDVQTVCHLLPPRPSESDDGLDEWRRQYRFGLFYYRVGPAFRAIKDMRRPGDKWSAVIDGPGMIALFDRFLLPSPVISDSGTVEDLPAEFLDSDILLLNHGEALTLPFRMRRWPIPYDAV